MDVCPSILCIFVLKIFTQTNLHKYPMNFPPPFSMLLGVTSHPLAAVRRRQPLFNSGPNSDRDTAVYFYLWEICFLSPENGSETWSEINYLITVW